MTRISSVLPGFIITAWISSFAVSLVIQTSTVGYVLSFEMFYVLYILNTVRSRQGFLGGLCSPFKGIPLILYTRLLSFTQSVKTVV